MLDYMYVQNERLAVTSDNVVALHFLGEYFSVCRLRWEAKTFWMQDLHPDNCHIYYQHATIFSDAKVLSGVRGICAACSRQVIENQLLLQLTAPGFGLGYFKKRRNIHRTMGSPVAWWQLFANTTCQNWTNHSFWTLRRRPSFQSLTPPIIIRL